MRNRALLGTLLLCVAAHAQNWALLNPAYRYNYSNDGTDTISNQIRVMHIDTLGPDSFRYELNLIGVVCDTCPASLGGPCDGCFVRVDQPQFMGYECIRSENNWTFQGKDTVLIRSDTDVGASWIFHAADGITATVDEEWATNVFGILDTLQKILLSDGDSILLSQSFGIMNFRRGAIHHDLLGVEGAGVGILLTDPMDFFDFQIGDELTYRVVDTYTATPQGGFPFPQTTHYYWRAVILGREDFQDSVRYATSVARTTPSYGYPGGGGLPWFWRMPQNPWVFDRAILNQSHPVLGAHPGQLLESTVVWSANVETGFLAEWSMSNNGRRVVRSKSLQIVPTGLNGGINLYSSPSPGLHPFFTGYDQTAIVNVQYEEGLGLIEVIRRRQSIIEYSVTLVGAIIAGDTIISPPQINWAVGIDEDRTAELSFHPNPAFDFIVLSSYTPGALCYITDLQGRAILVQRVTTTNARIDVQALPPGVYVLTMEGFRPQRFVIAR
ncbi:MAG: T9SS type A sorting domain-containing protein [Flavobacteriales bacterium]|nr:T9SS type A sorting domain-containing protein [Flavobacteriales bacterium]